MSSAEVYGASEGAPYKESHPKAPFNHYARAKWQEEQRAIAAHHRPTAKGLLHVTALRSWTISMVSYDEEGKIVGARNYNDPLITVAQQLASAGVRPPLVDPDVLCQFHLGEEIAELGVLMANQPLDSPVWGRALNATAQPATARELMDTAFRRLRVEPTTERPWWARLFRGLFGHGKVPRAVVVVAAYAMQAFGGGLGARDLGGRLPFLYRSTHMDDSAIRHLLGSQLAVPQGSSTVEAVERLASGLCANGAHSIAMKRYREY